MRTARLLLLPFLLLMGWKVQSQQFVTRWNMGVTGLAVGQLNVGVVTTGPCSYSWVSVPAGQSGSGTFSGDTMTIGNLPTSGWIDLSIDTTNFRQLRVANGPDKKRLILVTQWGMVKWSNCDSMFTGCSNMATLGPDTPDFSQVTSMEAMFAGAFTWSNTWMVYDIGSMPFWNTGSVTNMKAVFRGCGMRPMLGAWDVSMVTDMQEMFNGAWYFDDDLSNWDVSGVSNMRKMFAGCLFFNRPFNAWDMSQVADIDSMFYFCKKLNRTFESWVLNSAVHAKDCFISSGMDCTNFGTTLNAWANNPLMPDSIDLLGVWPKYGPFASAAVNYLTAVKGWNVSSVIDTTCQDRHFETTWIMDTLGSGPGQLLLPVETNGICSYVWKQNQVPVDSGTFSGTQLLITGLPTSGEIELVIRPEHFRRINMSLSLDRRRLKLVNNWGKVPWSSFDSSFAGCTNMNMRANRGPLLDSVASMAFMFDSCISLRGWPIAYPTNFFNWFVDSVKQMTGLFRNAILFNAPLTGWYATATTNLDHMFEGAGSFNQPLSSFVGSKATSMKAMFKGAVEYNRFMYAWNTSNVEYMDEMFQNALKFNQELDFNTQNVLSMRAMFKNAIRFNSDVNFADTKRVKDMSEMFAWAVQFNRSLYYFDTDSVVTMKAMFKNAKKFTHGDIENWNTKSVEDMGEMFWGAFLFNAPLGSWNTGKVRFMGRMFFSSTSFNQPLNAWDVSKVENMQGMFEKATSYAHAIPNWVFHSNVNTTNFLQNTAMNCHGYDSSLSGWAAQNQPSGIYLDAQRPYGNSGVAARLSLQNQKGWVFNDYWTNCTPLGEAEELSGGWHLGPFYPNPARTHSTLDIETPSSGQVLLTLSDMQGRTILHKEQHLQPGLNQMNLPLGELAPGLYLAALEVEGKRMVRRLEVGR